MKRKFFYAVEYWDGKKTTTGEPNPRTWRMSIACDLYVFKSKNERDNSNSKHSIIAPEGVFSAAAMAASRIHDS